MALDAVLHQVAKFALSSRFWFLPQKCTLNNGKKFQKVIKEPCNAYRSPLDAGFLRDASDTTIVANNQRIRRDNASPVLTSCQPIVNKSLIWATIFGRG